MCTELACWPLVVGGRVSLYWGAIDSPAPLTLAGLTPAWLFAGFTVTPEKWTSVTPEAPPWVGTQPLCTTSLISSLRGPGSHCDPAGVRGYWGIQTQSLSQPTINISCCLVGGRCQCPDCWNIPGPVFCGKPRCTPGRGSWHFLPGGSPYLLQGLCRW